MYGWLILIQMLIIDGFRLLTLDQLLEKDKKVFICNIEENLKIKKVTKENVNSFYVVVHSKKLFFYTKGTYYGFTYDSDNLKLKLSPTTTSKIEYYTQSSNDDPPKMKVVKWDDLIKKRAEEIKIKSSGSTPAVESYEKVKFKNSPKISFEREVPAMQREKISIEKPEDCNSDEKITYMPVYAKPKPQENIPTKVIKHTEFVKPQEEVNPYESEKMYKKFYEMMANTIKNNPKSNNSDLVVIESDSDMSEYRTLDIEIDIVDSKKKTFQLKNSKNLCVTYFQKSFLLTECSNSKRQIFKLFKIDDVLKKEEEKKLNDNNDDEILAEISSSSSEKENKPKEKVDHNKKPNQKKKPKEHDSEAHDGSLLMKKRKIFQRDDESDPVERYRREDEGDIIERSSESHTFTLKKSKRIPLLKKHKEDYSSSENDRKRLNPLKKNKEDYSSSENDRKRLRFPKNKEHFKLPKDKTAKESRVLKIKDTILKEPDRKALKFIDDPDDNMGKSYIDDSIDKTSKEEVDDDFHSKYIDHIESKYKLASDQSDNKLNNNNNSNIMFPSTNKESFESEDRQQHFNPNIQSQNFSVSTKFTKPKTDNFKAVTKMQINPPQQSISNQKPNANLEEYCRGILASNVRSTDPNASVCYQMYMPSMNNNGMPNLSNTNPPNIQNPNMTNNSAQNQVVNPESPVKKPPPKNMNLIERLESDLFGKGFGF